MYAVNGTCSCDDVHFNHPPKGLCKHRLGMYLRQRVMTLMQMPPVPVVPEMAEPWAANDPEDAPPVVPQEPQEPAPADPVSGIPAHFLTTIQGRPFARFEGLLVWLFRTSVRGSNHTEKPYEGHESS